MSTLMIGAENIANASGDSLAMLFGVTSPKIRMMIVMATVEAVGPALPPSIWMNRTVATDEAVMLTMLLPTSTEEISSS